MTICDDIFNLGDIPSGIDPMRPPAEERGIGFQVTEHQAADEFNFDDLFESISEGSGFREGSLFDDDYPRTEFLCRVCSGAVKLGEVEMGRGMKILDVLLPGDYFYSRPDSEKARYEALCGGVVISRCSVGLLKHFAIVRPEIGLMLHALTIRTLERLERQISIFVCKTPQAQLTAFFQTIFRRSRFRKKSSTASPISRADIGQYLGVPEQVLEECLSQLSTQGVVRLTGRGVIYIKNDCEL